MSRVSVDIDLRCGRCGARLDAKDITPTTIEVTLCVNCMDATRANEQHRLETIARYHPERSSSSGIFCRCSACKVHRAARCECHCCNLARAVRESHG